MAAGFKSGGRRKGTPNKATSEPWPPAKPDLSSSARTRAREAAPAKGEQIRARTRLQPVDPAMVEAALSAPLAMRVGDVHRLVAYPNNARTHSPESVDRLCALIKEFGWTNPILVAGQDVLAGHRRLSAALKLGMDFVPVIDLSHLSADQRRAYILADNKSALDAGWDDELLKFELEGLRDAGFDLSLTGFDGAELAGLFGSSSGLTDSDDAPAVQATAVSRAGDVWSLGAHRLGCGDSTDPVLVLDCLNGAKPHLMVTDPPYGVSYDANWRNSVMAEGIGAGRAIGKVANDGNADWREAWALFPGSVAYVWGAGIHSGSIANSLDAVRFRMRAQIVWVKTRSVISRGHYHWQHEAMAVAEAEPADEVVEHEMAAYTVRDGSTGHWHGDRKQSTVWFIEHIRSETGHSTQKPVECMRRPIENNSQPLDAIYEPFSGSGTTIIACEMTSRVCYAIEIDPLYVDVAIRRWQAFTGREATLGGQSFADVEAERAGEAA